MAANVKKSPKQAPAKSGNPFMLIAAVAIVGVGVLIYLVTRPKGVSIPANVAVLEADTAGFQGYFKGSDSAPVTITEYADYQCPACQYFATVQLPSVRRDLIETGLVRWRFRDFPLDAAHPHARLAAHSGACADDQGKFWEQHDAIFATHAQWNVATGSGATQIFREQARNNGLDLAAYDACMSSAKYAGRIQASLEEGTKVGVGSTPTFLIGGRLYPGAIPSDTLAAIARRLAGANQ